MIHRHSIPVDGHEYTFLISQGRIVHVACRETDVVEFWELYGGPLRTRRFTVVGTGQAFPPDTSYVGTALTPSGRFVWHLIEGVAS